MIQLSIAIISWNSLPLLRECLRSLEPLLSRRDVELVWVDNGSTDSAPQYVAERYPQAKIKLLNENKGVAYARNRAIELTAGRYVLLLDDDTQANADAIDTMMHYLDTHPDIGIAGCALHSADGSLQQSFKPYPSLLRKVANVLRSKLHIPSKQLTLPSAVIYPVYVIGACQMIRREVIDKIGLLDENIFYGPEDADYCLRASTAGWQTAYLPHISILHHWRRITNRSLNTPVARAHIRALIYFWRKHRRL